MRLLQRRICSYQAMNFIAPTNSLTFPKIGECRVVNQNFYKFLRDKLQHFYNQGPKIAINQTIIAEENSVGDMLGN